MLTRRFALGLAAALLPLARAALASGPMTSTPFSAAAFKAAQEAGKPILVAIHAGWCPTCKIQSVILGDLLKKPAFKNLVVLRVDFDDQKDIVSKFGADTQSTLIVFKGKTEAGRTVGDTSNDGIETLLKLAV